MHGAKFRLRPGIALPRRFLDQIKGPLSIFGNTQSTVVQQAQSILGLGRALLLLAPGAAARAGLAHPSICPSGAFAVKGGDEVLISIQCARALGKVPGIGEDGAPVRREFRG